jgi:hypothetical protein
LRPRGAPIWCGRSSACHHAITICSLVIERCFKEQIFIKI